MAPDISSPSADRGDAGHPGHGSRRSAIRPGVPRSLQTRLTLAFVGIVALTLALVLPVVINRLDDALRQREEDGLVAQRDALAPLLAVFVDQAARTGFGPRTVLVTDAETGEITLNPKVRDLLTAPNNLTAIAGIARANVRIGIGPTEAGVDGGPEVRPIEIVDAQLSSAPRPGQARDDISIPPADWMPAADPVTGLPPWGMQIELAGPLTSRASTIATVTGLVVVVGMIAMAVAVVVAALLSQRFAAPLRRLTDTSRRIAEGDLSSRVPADDASWTTRELTELARQFNAMADRLEESVNIIRSDRDRSRDFLADVSHELRTPIAAIRTFNELLQAGAADDPATRQEFLESSAVQLERLDWLAMNLLELSRLDSGLVLLDLRPEDLRATVESAIEQAEPSARRRGVALSLNLPDHPLRIRHDPPRVGQIVGNLVGNAIKFTARGGAVTVTASSTPDGSARIEVADTGVGIDASELPHIFERFYRGSSANEARSSGSGLGLSIAKSIVDMHGGTIAVESRVGHGSRFVVTLPRDPREPTDAERAAAGSDPAASTGAKVADSSPPDAPRLNRGVAR